VHSRAAWAAGGSRPYCRPRACGEPIGSSGGRPAASSRLLPYYLNLALDSGVKPREISEIITHLAFYSGWANAMSAVVIAKDIFAERKIGDDQLPAASPSLLPIDEAWETARATRVGGQFGATFPGMVQNTTDVLFLDLWLRPDLAPRDRSLVTVSALIASGQIGVSEVTYYRWRQEFGGLKTEQVKRLKDLELENSRLRKAPCAAHVADGYGLVIALTANECAICATSSGR
jgi:alkylhydroperoxidase/carboxymuconolactone decarboxylase family protein YurZ